MVQSPVSQNQQIEEKTQKSPQKQQSHDFRKSISKSREQSITSNINWKDRTPSMHRKELQKAMRLIQRDKKFTFKPQLNPLTERLASQKSNSRTNSRLSFSKSPQNHQNLTSTDFASSSTPIITNSYKSQLNCYKNINKNGLQSSNSNNTSNILSMKTSADVTLSPSNFAQQLISNRQNPCSQQNNIQQYTPHKQRKRWEELYDEDKVRRIKLKQQEIQLNEQRMTNEIVGCTFKPELNNHEMGQSPDLKSKAINKSAAKNKSPSTSPLKSATSLFDRNQKWKQEVDQKRLQQLSEQQAIELKSLTFKPQIGKYDKNKLVPDNQTTNSGKQQLESNMKAVDLYLKRMQKAKDEESRRQSIVFANKKSEMSMESYLNKPLTKPVTPKLSGLLQQQKSQANLNKSPKIKAKTSQISKTQIAIKDCQQVPI
eukprot:403359157